MLEALAPKAHRLGMEVTSLEIRDIILPGEIKRKASPLSSVLAARPRRCALSPTRLA